MSVFMEIGPPADKQMGIGGPAGSMPKWQNPMGHLTCTLVNDHDNMYLKNDQSSLRY